jgi:hypothetical protein
MEKLKASFETVKNTLLTLPDSQARNEALIALSDLAEIAHDFQIVADLQAETKTADEKKAAEMQADLQFDRNNPRP